MDSDGGESFLDQDSDVLEQHPLAASTQQFSKKSYSRVASTQKSSVATVVSPSVGQIEPIFDVCNEKHMRQELEVNRALVA